MFITLEMFVHLTIILHNLKGKKIKSISDLKTKSLWIHMLSEIRFLALLT